MKKILLISNSFGEDAARYLYGIARAAKERVKVVVLYIGGCSLYRHYRNMLSEERAYDYIIDGIRSGLSVSLKEALLSDEWDYVTLQQCSPLSGNEESYFPYITELASYIRKMSPAAKLYIHETWSFAEGCSRFGLTGFKSREEMIPAVKKAYKKAYGAINADGVLPSLAAMNQLYDSVGEQAYRDGFHCSLGLGRYMLGCLCFMTFFGIDVEGNTYRDLDVDITEEEVLLAQKTAKKTALDNGVKLKQL
jgi:hypothetical protein